MLNNIAETTECTMADVENADMVEVDENDEIETVDLAVDQDDCVGNVEGSSVGGLYRNN